MDCIGGTGGVEWIASCFGGGRIWEGVGFRRWSTWVDMLLSITTDSLSLL